MKKLFVTIVLLFHSYVSAAAWLSNAQTIPLGLSAGALKDVTMAYFPKTKTVVATWVDLSTNFPFYSVYNGTSWTTALQIPGSNTAVSNLNLQSFPFKKIIVAAWANNPTQVPYYCFFDGTSWTTAVPIGDGTVLVQNEIFMTYDKLNHNVVAAWADPSSAPYFSILDTTLSWIQPQPMPSSNVNDNVSLAYNKSIPGQVVATWGNAAFTPPQPYYSTLSGMTWSIPALIPPSPSVGVFNDIRVVYGQSFNGVVAAWGDATANPRLGYVDMFIGGTWQPTPGSLNFTPPCQGIKDNVSLGYITDTGSGFAAWADSITSTNLPFFDSSISLSGAIPPGTSTGVRFNVNLMYDQNSKKLIAAWSNLSTGQPYFNTFQ